MKPQSYKVFAQLLESCVFESSSAMKLLSAHPGGPAVVKHIHKNSKLAHDLEYSPTNDISWSEIKGSSSGYWILIQGSAGTAAIRSRGDNYDVVASASNEIKTLTDTHGGRIKTFLKTEIGPKLTKFYQARNTTEVRNKQKSRAERNVDAAGSSEVTKDTLIKKFRPLWIRAMTAAIADIKGHIANMIKNDAFDKAKKKLNYLDQMNDSLEELQSGVTDAPEYISKAVNTAVLMAASNHFPEQTGNLERSRYGSGLNAQFAEGPDLLLKAIAAGDTAKLGTVLGFFKKALITG